MPGPSITQTVKTLNSTGQVTLIHCTLLELATRFSIFFHHFDNLLVGSSIPECILGFIPGIFLILEQH
jgi:hypothetical protein